MSETRVYIGFGNLQFDGLRLSGRRCYADLLSFSVFYDDGKLHDPGETPEDRYEVHGCYIDRPEFLTLCLRTVCNQVSEESLVLMQIIASSVDDETDAVAEIFWSHVVAKDYEKYFFLSDKNDTLADRSEFYFNSLLKYIVRGVHLRTLRCILRSIKEWRTTNNRLFREAWKVVDQVVKYEATFETFEVFVHEMHEYGLTLPLERLSVSKHWDKADAIIIDQLRGNSRSAVKSIAQYLWDVVYGVKNYEAVISLIYRWLDTCEVVELSKERLLSRLLNEHIAISILNRYEKLSIHTDNDAALRNAICRGYKDLVEELIFRGADINAAYSKTKKIKEASGPTVDIVERYRPLHDLLRQQEYIPEENYVNYYKSEGCVKAAREFGSFGKVENMYVADRKAASTSPRRF